MNALFDVQVYIRFNKPGNDKYDEPCKYLGDQGMTQKMISYEHFISTCYPANGD